MDIPALINALDSNAGYASLWLYNLEDEIDWTTVSQFNLDSHGGVGWIAYWNRYVLSELLFSVQYFIYGGVVMDGYKTWRLLHTGLYEQEAEVTWKAICEAWVADNFEGKKWTIACIDHMRKLMWDQPFSIQWAAQPKAEST